jgi:hypothetical protein
MKPYILIESFLTFEECQPIKDFLLANEDYDPRDFYGNLSLGQYVNGDSIDIPFDPMGTIEKYVNFSKKTFEENYTMLGEFGLNRIHGNYMHTGAVLSDHQDDRANEKPLEEINSLTYVAGLFLNDDYEGGELFFPDLGIRLKPKTGDLVLFPGYSTKHGVDLITFGTRLNILAHFFDIKDVSIPYQPDYAVDPSIIRDKK